jgi:lycopene elongase/hydratase (dihydrobisanhydrobacterioruberin-forming)
VVSQARRIGYRLVGTRLDYLLHTRPVEWPIVAAHTALGYLLAVGLNNSLRSDRLGAALLGILLWVVCLNGGTLALNSAFDRDEGDIAYLRQPPTPPRALAEFGLGLMLLGLGVALLLPLEYQIAYLICLLLSVLYSVPPLRLKAVPGADWLINMWGFGTLTPFAGWAATGLPLGPVGRLILLAFCPLFAALYPLTQLYQIEEDARRGDRTLVLWLGMGRSLVTALAAAVLAFALFTVAALRSNWEGAEQWRWLVLTGAALAWGVVLIPWLLRWRYMMPRDHQHGMYRALFAWALTDIAVVLAWAA